MSQSIVKGKIDIWIKKVEKYKMALLVLVLGICLMIIPKGNEHPTVQNDDEVSQLELEEQLEQRLEQTLCMIDGAGDVRVVLSLQEGETYTYQTDTENAQDDQQKEQSTETVLITDSDGNEKPVMVSILYPVYKGAVILCQGADSPTVRLSIVNAVSDLTGLGSDKISVIKMKAN